MRYKVDNVKNYSSTKGWICGHFMPDGSIQKNSEMEIKYEILNPGATSLPHYHPIGIEVCLVITGKIKLNIEGEEVTLTNGDFVYMPKDITESLVEVYEPSIVVYARTPSVPNNKVVKEEK